MTTPYMLAGLWKGLIHSSITAKLFLLPYVCPCYPLHLEYETSAVKPSSILQSSAWPAAPSPRKAFWQEETSLTELALPPSGSELVRLYELLNSKHQFSPL